MLMVIRQLIFKSRIFKRTKSAWMPSLNFISVLYPYSTGNRVLIGYISRGYGRQTTQTTSQCKGDSMRPYHYICFYNILYLSNFIFAFITTTTTTSRLLALALSLIFFLSCLVVYCPVSTIWIVRNWLNVILRYIR